MESIESTYTETLIWGGVFLFLVILLFICSKVLKSSIGRKLQNTTLPFAISPKEVEELKKRGALTDEEWKAVRAAQAKRLVERAKAEQRTREMPANAEVALAAAEAKLREKGAGEIARESPIFVVGHGTATAPAKVASPPPVPAPHGDDEIPQHLTPLLAKSDMELQELVDAGFLPPADAERIRRKAGRL